MLTMNRLFSVVSVLLAFSFAGVYAQVFETGSRVGIMKHGRPVDTLDTEGVQHTDLERIYLEHMHD